MAIRQTGQPGIVKRTIIDKPFPARMAGYYDWH